MAWLTSIPILYTVAGVLALLSLWAGDVRGLFLAAVCLLAGFLQDVRSGRLGRGDDDVPPPP